MTNWNRLKETTKRVSSDLMVALNGTPARIETLDFLDRLDLFVESEQNSISVRRVMVKAILNDLIELLDCADWYKVNNYRLCAASFLGAAVSLYAACSLWIACTP